MAKYTVELVFTGTTNVWMTEAAYDRICEHDGTDPEDTDKPLGGMLKKLHYFSQAGFFSHEGGNKTGKPIKHEWSRVYRIGLYGNLFRLYGFYEDDPKKTVFVVLIAHAEKKGKKNTFAEKRWIDEVARARDERDWQKRE